MHNTLSEGLHKDIEYIISYLFFRKIGIRRKEMQSST